MIALKTKPITAPEPRPCATPTQTWVGAKSGKSNLCSCQKGCAAITAEEIGTWWHGGTATGHHRLETLYRTKSGPWFWHGTRGARSPDAELLKTVTPSAGREALNPLHDEGTRMRAHHKPRGLAKPPETPDNFFKHF